VYRWFCMCFLCKCIAAVSENLGQAPYILQ
jgi:hypothetical protein